MIVEVRSYRVERGTRDRFLELFRTRSVPLQRSIGIGVVGPFVDLEDPDAFVWLRTFPSLEARDRMTRELYEGEAWTAELRGILLPMLAGHTVVLAGAPPWLVDDLPRPSAGPAQRGFQHPSPDAR